MRGIRWLTDFFDDMQYAIRSLRRASSLTAFVVITLALGIGMTSASFSMVDALVFRPYPVSHPSSVVSLVSTTHDSGLDSFSYREYLDLRGRTKSYDGVVANAALGPVGFPHRDSANEIPQAPIAHHYEDSTHIADDVITAGVSTRFARLEASAFHGAEPDEQRWDLDGGKLDSESVRLVITPIPSLSAQASWGYLTKPEKIEPGDQKRTTASLSYTLGGWSSSAIWGRVYKESHDNTIEAVTLESTLRFARRNTIALRFESAEKDELFPHTHPTGKIERPALPVPRRRVACGTVIW